LAVNIVKRFGGPNTQSAPTSFLNEAAGFLDYGDSGSEPEYESGLRLCLRSDIPFATSYPKSF
jgi:hypothetical protein